MDLHLGRRREDDAAPAREQGLRPIPGRRVDPGPRPVPVTVRTLEARQGNPLPRYYGFPGGSINSMGLPNLGYRAYAELIPELKQFGKPVIASVAGLCEDDFPAIARVINDAGPDLIEVNLSCPNIPGKPQIGYDADASERLMKRVRPLITVPMGVKLPPYFDPAHHQLMGDVISRSADRMLTTPRPSGAVCSRSSMSSIGSPKKRSAPCSSSTRSPR